MTNEQTSISKMLFEPIFVPVEGANADDVALLKFPLEQGELAVGFSSVLKLARFCGENTNYIETSSSELFGQLIASQTWFGFDFDGEDGDIYDNEALSGFLKHLETDIELTPSKSIEFSVPTISQSFQARLNNLLVEFKSQVEVGVVEDGTGQLILSLRKQDLQNEVSLLAKAHQLVSSDEERLQISILTCESFDSLGANFLSKAVFVTAPNVKIEAIKPPILRY